MPFKMKNFGARIVICLLFSVTVLLAENGTARTPVIFPHPWQIKYSNDSLDVKKFAVKNIGSQERLKAAIEDFAKTMEIPCTFLNGDRQVSSDSTLIVLDNGSDPAIKGIIGKEFPDIKINELGEQGYFLAITGNDKPGTIYISANTEQGRFYGLQTLKQLMNHKKGTLQLAVVADKPTISIRGIPMGSQWFEKREEAVKRLSSLKCNHIHNPDMGWALNYKLGTNGWRKPFTNDEKIILKNYLKLCKDNFIDVTLSFGPRGTPPLQYSSDNDINLIVGKMSDLHKLGFRDFCINFDDLQNTEEHGLIVPEDIKRFDNDFGKAHYYFVMTIYERLKKLHPDATLKMLPLYYGGFLSVKESGVRYLHTIGKLPKEIGFVTCPYSDEEVRRVTELTGRAPFIWDNYYANWGDHGKLPVFTSPLIRSNNLNSQNIKGYIFIPSLPKWEDIILLSWLTSTDFMWSPERYTPDESFKNALLKIPTAPENIPTLKEYSDYILGLLKYPVPATTKAERLAWLAENIDKLKMWEVKLKNMVPAHVFDEIHKEITFHLKNLEEVKADQEQKAFPVIVNKTDSSIKIDGALDEKTWKNAERLTGFTTLKGNIAKYQTEAYFLYDENKLYIGVVCDEPFPEQIVAKRKDRDANVYQDDCVEMFFDVKQARSAYFHIVVNSQGTVYDAFGGGLDACCWNGNLTIATGKGKTSWTMEMAIPFKDLGVKEIQKGTRWNFNIARERWVKPVEVSSYSLLLYNGFHNSSRFWTLEFK